MNKTIWKYQLDTTDKQTITMPFGAEILSVQMQGLNPCMWVLVNPSKELEDRYIEIYGTGHIIGCDMGIDRAYIGTYQVSGNQLVFHVFERID